MDNEKVTGAYTLTGFMCGFICITIIIFRMASCNENIRVDELGNKYVPEYTLKHLEK